MLFPPIIIVDEEVKLTLLQPQDKTTVVKTLPKMFPKSNNLWQFTEYLIF